MREPPPELIDGLRQRYGEPQRHYHTWAHIEALLRHFETIRDGLCNAEAVLWALYWHDAIYDPQASDNEDRSAGLLQEQASDHLSKEALELADRIIRATKRHEVPVGLTAKDESDLKHFLDIDLSILAAAEPVFDAYEDQIRAEYTFVPEPIYRQARGGILQGFLQRDRLYFTDHFYRLWETQARTNLKRSIARLTQEG